MLKLLSSVIEPFLNMKMCDAIKSLTFVLGLVVKYSF